MAYQVHEATEIKGSKLVLWVKFSKVSDFFYFLFSLETQNEDSKGLLFAIQTLVT